VFDHAYGPHSQGGVEGEIGASDLWTTERNHKQTRGRLATRHVRKEHPLPVTPRFLQLADVADVLNISAAQAYALVRSGELPAIKIGGRGQWRVEAAALEKYIERMYSETKDFISAHPYGKTEDF
jgi:excisionase family DNA binding protein